MKRVALLDNHDSFTWNLADLLVQAGAPHVDVLRNTEANLAALRAELPDALVISPGPNAPEDAGGLLPFLGDVLGRLPVWGVCLGHQALAVALGGRVHRAAEPVHGQVAPILHAGRGLFAGLPRPLPAMRYHSLAAVPGSLPAEVEVMAWLADGTPMALRCQRLRCDGVQFHPESVGTPHGVDVARAWLQAAGVR